MSSLTLIDYAVIFGFLGVLLIAGLTMSRRASKDLESYFLGGRNVPWYLLGITGMSAWFDLTGTMIITSFLYMLGPQGLFIEFRGGAVLALAFMLAYTGKWHRRSGCMTPAEWNTFRFGTGFSGELLRLVSALMGIIMTIGMLAYLVRGATLFMGMIFPLDPVVLTIGLLGLATLYTVLAGFYGVVITDLVQSAIMIAGCIVISIIAWRETPDVATLTSTAHAVTGNVNWTTSAPSWHADMPKGYEAYQSLIMAAAFYLLRSVLGGMGSGAEPRFFAARNPREASMQCLLQGLTVMFRWPLMISFAILGIFFVAKTVPDKNSGIYLAEIIKKENPDVTAHSWHSHTSRIAFHPEKSDYEVIKIAKDHFGSNWASALMMIGPNGEVNPEVILPTVVMNSINPGLRGLLIVSLLAALMGTLTGSVNGASALLVRDIYQNFFRRFATNRELIFVAYISSGGIIVASFLMGLSATSINDIWTWIIMGLTAGALGPQFLRLYWWRTNAWGMAAGLFAGGLSAVLQRLFLPSLSEWWQFPIITAISFAATVLGSLATVATPHSVVRFFYETTRPFGSWGPFWKELHPNQRSLWRKEHQNDIFSTVTTLIWQVCLFLLPMQILTRNWQGCATTVPIFVAGSLGLYFFWWRNLPSSHEKIPDFASKLPVPHAPMTLEAARDELSKET